jgi:hypothetical protein
MTNALGNASGAAEGLLVRAEPLGWAEELCRRMVRVERTTDGALLLDADLAWAASINEVLVKKGVRVAEMLAWRPARSTAA